MTQNQFTAFSSFRSELKSYCDTLNSKYRQQLFALSAQAAQKDTPEYPHETAVVYNTALDEITADSDIHLIVIGDNPGKDEQLAKNQKYLVGQAGKLGAKFFKDNPQLNTDFRKNAIILNKTPVHSAKTNHLRQMAKSDSHIAQLILDSQIKMAQLTARLQQALGCEIWMVGYGELKDNGIFGEYKKALIQSYTSFPQEWKKVFVFQHFSMNRFTIDLKAYMQNHPELSLAQAIHQLGTIHKNEFFIPEL